MGIFYRPPDQNDFLEIISHDFSKLSTDKKEIYILGDININTVINGKSIFGKVKNIGISAFQIPSIAKQYYEFCSMLSLKQLIESPTRITCNSSTIIDHILTNSCEKIVNSGVIDLSLSDHQIIFCTRKLMRQKFNFHKQIKCRLLKNILLIFLLKS